MSATRLRISYQLLRNAANFRKQKPGANFKIKATSD